MTPEVPKPRWYHVHPADIVFLALTLIIFLGCRRGMLDDPGLGWHLRNIDAMLQQGNWLTHDPFSGPRHGVPYRTNQWLGELPLWLGWKWAGLEGIAIVTALVLACMFRCMFRYMMRDGAPWPVAVLFTTLAAFATTPSWVARPNIFTMLFVLWTARSCILFHEDRCTRLQTMWLLPLFTIWANIHGGFIAGFAILVGTALIEGGLALIQSSSEARVAARTRAIHWILLAGGCFGTTLLNPYGYSLYPWIFQLLGEPFFMDLHMEWRSPNFHAAGAFRYELLLLLFPILLALSRRRPTLVELGLSIFFLHMAFSGVRYVPLWVIVATPVMVRSSLDLPILHDLAKRFAIDVENTPMLQPRTETAHWTLSAVFAVILFVASWPIQGRVARHNPEYIPMVGLDRLIALHRETPDVAVFHSYNWGGYLTWKGWPTLLNWIDDRNEVQGRDHIEEHFSIEEARPGWRAKLDRANVRYVAVTPGVPLATHLATRTDTWTERYRDAYVVIYDRNGVRSP